MLDITKAFLVKGEFGMARDDLVYNLDERIEEQAKHVPEMEQSLVETKEFVLKLEERLELAKVYLGSLN